MILITIKLLKYVDEQSEWKSSLKLLLRLLNGFWTAVVGTGTGVLFSKYNNWNSEQFSFDPGTATYHAVGGLTPINRPFLNFQQIVEVMKWYLPTHTDYIIVHYYEMYLNRTFKEIMPDRSTTNQLTDRPANQQTDTRIIEKLHFQKTVHIKSNKLITGCSLNIVVFFRRF